MSRIAACFEQLRDIRRTALIPYLTAGDPQLEITLRLMHTFAQRGADLIEVGVPFTDPMADGPVIQRAGERALKNDVSLSKILALVRRFRAHDARTPVILMGYLNPMEAYGYESFVRDARNAGVDGVLTVDLPLEESREFAAALRRADIDPIQLIAPTTTGARLQGICQAASGFLYYVSVKGTTGTNKLDRTALASKIEQIRKYTTLPVGIGFGIKDAETAAAVAQICEAVIVGSAIIARMEQEIENGSRLLEAAGSFVAELRSAMDGRACA